MQRREEARHERVQKRRDYLEKKAVAYETYIRFENLWKFLQPQIAESPDGPASPIIRTLGNLVAADRQQFATSTIEEEVHEQGLFAEDDADDAT